MSASETPVAEGRETVPNFPLYCLPNEAQALADYQQRLALQVVPRNQWPDQAQRLCQSSPAWWLQYERGRLRLLRAGDRLGVCVQLEELRRRAVRQSELAKACGMASGKRPSLLDGTGGWGLDALCLAQLGARVSVVERLPPMWALIQDLAQCSGAADVALYCADVWQWLPDQAQVFDVVYLDPMFAPRKKSAAPNKRLQYLAELVTALSVEAKAQSELDSEHGALQWLQQCARFARERIVLKRRRHDPPLLIAPDWQIKGRSVRYDVFKPARLVAGF